MIKNGSKNGQKTKMYVKCDKTTLQKFIKDNKIITIR